MIELVTTLAVLAVAFVMYSGTSISIQRQRDNNRRSAIAADGAQRMLETMRSRELASLYGLYGSGSVAAGAPGPSFDVEGLEPTHDDPDGHVGEVLLPEMQIELGVWQLREDVRLAALGMPRDLNGDSRIDALDHAEDFICLPVVVRVAWQSRFGPRSYELTGMLANFKH